MGIQLRRCVTYSIDVICLHFENIQLMLFIYISKKIRGQCIAELNEQTKIQTTQNVKNLTRV